VYRREEEGEHLRGSKQGVEGRSMHSFVQNCCRSGELGRRIRENKEKKNSPRRGSGAGSREMPLNFADTDGAKIVIKTIGKQVCKGRKKLKSWSMKKKKCVVGEGEDGTSWAEGHRRWKKSPRK